MSNSQGNGRHVGRFIGRVSKPRAIARLKANTPDFEILAHPKIGRGLLERAAWEAGGGGYRGWALGG
jgi:hypothetical protein